MSRVLDENTLKRLAEGGRVLLLPEPKDRPAASKGVLPRISGVIRCSAAVNRPERLAFCATQSIPHWPRFRRSSTRIGSGSTF